ncbi:MAG TPA: AraC family transcriptional regulator [Candidatus Binatia bacterium]|nr:AraC family transcriptional regulator [Candidatus Binatia bacterium]
MPEQPRRPPSTLASWSANLIRALDAHEGESGSRVSGSELAVRAGIDPGALDQAEARVPRAALTRFWQLAVEATGDPCFGLVAARHVTQTTFHALGYAVLASSTLREAFERIVRYRRLIGDIIEMSLVADGDRYRFVIDVSARPATPDRAFEQVEARGVPFEAIDAVIAVCVRQAVMLSGGSCRPLEVAMRRPEPAQSHRFEQAYHCTVRFSQPQNVIVFSRSDLETPLPSANAELARQNDEAVSRYLARIGSTSIVERVQHALLDVMPQGPPSKQLIARRLAMSPRNLQRKLEEEGTTFKRVLEDARLSLARSYIEERRHSVTEIAFLLGFADTSTFSRAFKRWTGVAPRAARTRSA